MKQYQISFYRKLFAEPVAIYYREFNGMDDAREWAKDMMNSNIYSTYRIAKIPMSLFLKNS